MARKPSPSRVGPLALALAATASALLGAAPAVADDAPPATVLDLNSGSLDLGLTVYWGGFTMAEIEAQIRFDDADYSLRFDFTSAGMLAWMVDASSRVEAHGRRGDDGRLIPLEFHTDSTFDGRNRRLRLNFDESGATTAIDYWQAEGFDPTAREPVPVAMRQSPDPVSAILLAGMTSGGKLPTGARGFATFDGKRAMSFTLDCADTPEPLRPSRLSAYVGPAIRCAAGGAQVAGFHNKFRNRNIRLDRPAAVWMAKAWGRDLYLPVRFELETQYGSIVGHVSRIGPAPVTD